MTRMCLFWAIRCEN